MSDGLALSEDGYLLQKVIHQSTLKKIIDTSYVNFEKPISKEKMLKAADKESGERQPKEKSVVEEYYIQQFYHAYNKPREGDIICWYDDIRPLSGTAGYVLIRDGYVYSTVVLWRS